MKFQSLLVTTLLLLPLSTAATAGPLIDLLKARQIRLDRILETRAAEMTTAQKNELRTVIGEVFDFPAMARAALGDHWTDRAEADRLRFVEVFERLIKASSVRGVDAYRADGVKYLNEESNGKAGRVKTTVNSKNALTEVDYSFEMSKTSWAVVDYTIDGVSAVKNYRAQFTKILDKKGWDELLKRVVRSAEKLENANDGDEKSSGSSE